MSDSKNDKPGSPPHVQLIQMTGLTNVAHCLCGGEGWPIIWREAQKRGGTGWSHQDTRHRASIGILTESDSHRFGLTTLGEALEWSPEFGGRA